MKTHDAYSKLEKLISSDLKDLELNSIIPDGAGVLAFGKYSIQPNDHEFVCVKESIKVGTFTSRKVALSWCIADKYRQHSLSHQIQELDKKRSALSSDIDVRSRIANRSKDASLYNCVENKLESKREKLLRLNLELDKCINLAKYWQIRGFNNEISRTGRQASHR